MPPKRQSMKGKRAPAGKPGTKKKDTKTRTNMLVKDFIEYDKFLTVSQKKTVAPKKAATRKGTKKVVAPKKPVAPTEKLTQKQVSDIVQKIYDNAYTMKETFHLIRHKNKDDTRYTPHADFVKSQLIWHKKLMEKIKPYIKTASADDRHKINKYGTRFWGWIFNLSYVESIEELRRRYDKENELIKSLISFNEFKKEWSEDCNPIEHNYSYENMYLRRLMNPNEYKKESLKTLTINSAIKAGKYQREKNPQCKNEKDVIELQDKLKRIKTDPAIRKLWSRIWNKLNIQDLP